MIRSSTAFNKFCWTQVPLQDRLALPLRSSSPQASTVPSTVTNSFQSSSELRHMSVPIPSVPSIPSMSIPIQTQYSPSLVVEPSWVCLACEGRHHYQFLVPFVSDSAVSLVESPPAWWRWSTSLAEEPPPHQVDGTHRSLQDPFRRHELAVMDGSHGLWVSTPPAWRILLRCCCRAFTNAGSSCHNRTSSPCLPFPRGELQCMLSEHLTKSASRFGDH